MKSALVIKKLSVSYQNNCILENFDFSVNVGSLLAIVGPNGSGKTTLVQSIMGLLPSTGTITIFGQPLATQQHKIAYIAQRSSVDWTFPASVFDVVMMGRYGSLQFGQRPSLKDKNIVIEVLEKVGLIAYKDHPIGQLSGGQQQRVFLARALAQQADLYIMDEPFVGVDIVTERIMFTIFQQLKQDNKTIIVVHHDLLTVKKNFDSICFINRKKIAFGPIITTMTPENIALTFQSSIELNDFNFL